MLIAEQELPIEVAEVDGVEVDDVDLAETGEDEVLEKLATDPSCAYHQYLALYTDTLASEVRARLLLKLTRLMVPCSEPRLWRADLSRPIVVDSPD
jgi:hypothetical protein